MKAAIWPVCLPAVQLRATNGSGGAKNILTQEEIDACDGIIIAADKNVEMARFDGKPVIKVKVSDGIHKSQELIERAVKGDGPILLPELRS